MKRGVEFVIEPVAKLEHNLQVDPVHQPLPSKPPVHHSPRLLAWPEAREVHYSGVSQVLNLLGQGPGQEMLA
eukprot:3147666-Prorocentrum_lima.AAC.1